MSARTATARVATEDVEVPPPAMTPEDHAALAEAAKQPIPSSIMDALVAAGEANKSTQAAARKTARDATAKATSKPKAKAKAAATPKVKAAPKAKAERVPAARVEALLAELGLSKSQLAQATKRSPSLVSEWVGKGRGHLMAETEWKAVEPAARKFAKSLK